jgi:hypothetical protein
MGAGDAPIPHVIGTGVPNVDLAVLRMIPANVIAALLPNLHTELGSEDDPPHDLVNISEVDAATRHVWTLSSPKVLPHDAVLPHNSEVLPRT